MPVAIVIVLFLAGVRWKVFMILGVLASLMAPLLWKFALRDYQRSRILTLLDPESDPLGSGYHIIQSKIAIGSGGVYGKGWLNGTQSQLDFLPERSTDFIFSVVGEELGLIGVMLFLVVLAWFLQRVLRVSADSPPGYGSIIAFCFFAVWFGHLVINIGMTVGLMPVTGLPLPFLSYGGSFLLTTFIGLGLVCRSAYET